MEETRLENCTAIEKMGGGGNVGMRPDYGRIARVIAGYRQTVFTSQSWRLSIRRRLK